MENKKQITFKETKENYGIPYILDEAKKWYDSNKDSIEQVTSAFTTILDNDVDEIVYRRALVISYKEKESSSESTEVTENNNE